MHTCLEVDGIVEPEEPWLPSALEFFVRAAFVPTHGSSKISQCTHQLFTVYRMEIAILGVVTWLLKLSIILRRSDWAAVLGSDFTCSSRKLERIFSDCSDGPLGQHAERRATLNTGSLQHC